MPVGTHRPREAPSAVQQESLERRHGSEASQVAAMLPQRALLWLPLRLCLAECNGHHPQQRPLLSGAVVVEALWGAMGLSTGLPEEALWVVEEMPTIAPGFAFHHLMQQAVRRLPMRPYHQPRPPHSPSVVLGLLEVRGLLSPPWASVPCCWEVGSCLPPMWPWHQLHPLQVASQQTLR